ncbi:ATP-binding protein [Candidatus Bathyarchaeota archaeon]|nr:ATP-binding protein [Candidatus Bathyarchaeota archaeon]
MIISIASGKGGTGKTSVAANLAISIGGVQLIDCDVEEPNLHLLFPAGPCIEEPVYRMVPMVESGSCDNCGRCSSFCRYHALFTTPIEVLFFPELCHGCGGCLLVCPRKAISEGRHRIGRLLSCRSGDIELVYGELEVSEPMAVPLIREVKRRISPERDVIIDSPPGVSCPVIESVKGSDYCLLVTEPTPFGLHDLKMAVQVLEEMGITFGIVINRSGLGDREVYDYAEARGIPILLEIPYRRRIAELYSRGIPFSLEMPGWKERFKELFDEVRGLVKG